MAERNLIDLWNEYCGRVYDKSYEELCFEPEDGE